RLRKLFLRLIDREAKLAAAGRPTRIVAKMNALVDPELIEALYAASQAGVRVDLIVRGICCLRPGVPGVSERIRFISIIGHFMEHSRIFYFSNGGKDEFYFGSADWMPRNFDRRVEAVTPVDDRALQQRLHPLLRICLADNRQAWELNADGSYVQRNPGDDPEISTHKLLIGDPWGTSAVGIDRRLAARDTSGPRDSPAAELDTAQSSSPSSSS